MAALSQVLGFFFLLSLLPWLAVTIHHGHDCWPRGKYGLPKAGAGCPGSCSDFVWEEGYRLFEAGYEDSEAPNLSGIFLRNETQLQFCMKSSFNQCVGCPTTDWPDGSYCIYRHQDAYSHQYAYDGCPAGFMQGSVTYVRPLSSNRHGGSVPAGVYTRNFTMLEFCCKESSISRSVNIVLPNSRAFYLLAAQNGSCQSVQGMNASEEVLIWSNVSVSINGTVPKGPENNSLELAFCYYRPTSSVVKTVNGSSDVGTSNGNAYIAGMSVLCAILIMLVVTIVFGFGLCYVVRKRARQADIVIDRMNELQQLMQHPYTAVNSFAVAPSLADADDADVGDMEDVQDVRDVQEAPDRFSYPFFRAHSYSRPKSMATKHPQEHPMSSDRAHFYENFGDVPLCNVPAQTTKEGEEKEDGNLPEEFLTATDEDNVYETPLSTEGELIQELREMIIKFDDLSDPLPLGSGRFGNVLKVTWNSPAGSVEVAVKKLNDGALLEERVKFLQEAAIMKQFNHPNVVEIKGVAIDCLNASQSNDAVIVMELMANGDLLNYLHKMTTALSNMPHREVSDLLIRFARETASGMEYLSRKKFVHRDLAARNILLNSNYICKISDFGLARDMEDAQYYSAAGGLIPLKWTAPEALGYKKYSSASDVWSYGCVLYELWSLGQKPLSQWTIEEFYSMLLEGHRQTPPRGCPRSIYKLMMDCWHPRPRERPTFSAISYTLQQPTDRILHWPDTDSMAHTQTSFFGADSASGETKYLSLQRMYLDQ